MLARVGLCVVLAAAFLAGSSHAQLAEVGFFSGQLGDELGWEIDVDGDHAVVGALFASATGDNVSGGPRTGSATFYLRTSDDVWTKGQEVFGAGENDRFGQDVAIDGVWAAVGAISAAGNTSVANREGAVYVYKRDTTTQQWAQVQVLHGASDEYTEEFGYRVSIDSSSGTPRMIVGAPEEDRDGADSNDQRHGAVYIFELSTAGVWERVALVHGPDDENQLGFNVAITGDYAFAGGNASDFFPGLGFVYVIARQASGEWEVAQTLEAPTPAEQELYSRGLDADGDILAVGAALANPPISGNPQGELVVYRRNSGGVYELQQVIEPDSNYVVFGLRVVVKSGVIVASAPLDGTTAGNPRSGQVRVFLEVDGVWLQATEVIGDTGEFEWFGRGLGYSHEPRPTLIVGSYQHSSAEAEDESGQDNTASGAVWFYEGTLEPPTPPPPPPPQIFDEVAYFEGQVDDQFGWEVDISGDYALVGAYRGSATADNVNSGGQRNGSATFFARVGGEWTKVEEVFGAGVNDRFGQDVAIDGVWAAVGATSAAGNASVANREGAVYVYKRDTTTQQWAQVQVLHGASDEYTEEFGFRVSIDSSSGTPRMIVGAPDEDKDGADSNDQRHGAVYIFELSTSGVWERVALVHGPDDENVLGYNVAITGDYAFAGGDAGDSFSTGRGFAFVIARQASGEWEVVQTLEAPTPADQELYSRGLDADGDILAVGAATANEADGLPMGELVVYRRNSSGLYELQQVIEPNPDYVVFGLRVMVKSGVIVASASVNTQLKPGHVRVFLETDGVWTQVAEVVGDQDVAGSGEPQWFGRGLAYSHEPRPTIVIGAFEHSGALAEQESGLVGETRSGAVWFYEGSFDTAPPGDAELWVAPCGCDGLGSQPIEASSTETTSVTLSFDTSPASNAECQAVPADA